MSSDESVCWLRRSVFLEPLLQALPFIFGRFPPVARPVVGQGLDSTPEQLEADARTHLLRVREMNPEHGQRLEQARRLQGTGIHSLKAELFSESRNGSLGCSVIAADKHRSLLGAEAWALLDSARPAAPDRSTPGPDRAALARVLDAIERI